MNRMFGFSGPVLGACASAAFARAASSAAAATDPAAVRNSTSRRLIVGCSGIAHLRKEPQNSHRAARFGLAQRGAGVGEAAEECGGSPAFAVLLVPGLDLAVDLGDAD